LKPYFWLKKLILKYRCPWIDCPFQDKFILSDLSFHWSPVHSFVTFLIRNKIRFNASGKPVPREKFRATNPSLIALFFIKIPGVRFTKVIDAILAVFQFKTMLQEKLFWMNSTLHCQKHTGKSFITEGRWHTVYPLFNCQRDNFKIQLCPNRTKLLKYIALFFNFSISKWDQKCRHQNDINEISPC
jgi:hypothetical protein